MTTKGPGCSIAPSVENGYPSGSISGTPKTVSFVCNPGYTMSGNPTFTCKSDTWYGNADCTAWYIKDASLVVCVDRVWDNVVCFFTMSCDVPPSLNNGYPVSEIDTSGRLPSVKFSCSPQFTLSGSPKFYCNTTSKIWYGDAKCSPQEFPKVWFWLLIGLAVLGTIAALTALCVYCYRKCGRRSRVRPMHSDEEENVGACGGCCDYGGSCDICGCIDYYGCCSLFGCCGYRGLCSCCCFTCCRCCREPDETHVHGNKSLNVNRGRKRRSRAGKLSRKTNMKARQKRRNLWRVWKSQRPQNPLDDEVYERVRKEAKVLAVWMPHTNPIRSINTSTK